MSRLKVYAWTKPGIANFGDEMGPDILRRLGHTVERVPVHEADVVTIGSVMHHMTGAHDGVIIAGAGVMHAYHSISPAKMEVRLVRGDLTRKALGMPNAPVGDPAMLASLLYPKGKKKYKIGWVPHYMDDRIFTVADKTINVLDSPADVVEQITQCEYILTSSLHAMIVAQSFEIPVQRFAHPRVLGGDTKWVDYATGVAHGTKAKIYNILEGL